MKKALSIILTLLLTAAVFTGCTGGAGTEGSGTVSEIIWYYPGDKQSDLPVVLDELNNRLEKEPGIKLSLRTIDNSSYAEKMNLVVSSGEEFDICFTANWSLPFLPNVENGAFMPLNDLIKNNAPKLLKAMPEYVWGATTINGDIYAVPNYQILPTQFSLITTKELSDKYSFDYSKITDVKSLEPFLAEIKKSEPDLYPYQPLYSDVEMNYEQIYPTNFVVIAKNAQGDVKAYNWYELDEYKNHINLMHEWYKKGYIRKDVVGSAGDSASLLGLKYAFFWGTIKPGGDIELLQRYKKEMVSIAMCEPYTQTSATARTLSAISRTSKNPEKAIKLIEMLNTDKELYNLFIFGIEGKHYEKIEDNLIRPIENSGYKMDAWKFGNQFNAMYKEGQETDTWEKTIELNDSAEISPIWGFNLNSQPIKNEISQCSAVVKEFDFLKTGSENPQAHYEQFISKMRAAGSDRILKEVQDQLDKWLVDKK